MKFRRFNELGLSRFRDYLQQLKHEDPRLAPPAGLLDSDEFTEPLAPMIEADPHPFANRMAFAEWLHKAAEQADTPIPRSDAHFWAWLSLMLFEQVCPSDGNGKRNVREMAWYIPALDDRRREYRHSLYGSYNVYYLHKSNPESVAILLHVKLTTLGHFWYQLASRQDLIGSQSVVEAATRLYTTDGRRSTKRGSVGSKPGNLFRFVKLLNQIERVWDVPSCGADRILNLLPDEFNRYRQAGELQLT